MNSNRQWSSREATIELTITPPFWLTWWFKLLVVASIVGGAIAVVPGIAAAADAAGGSRAMTDEFGGRKAMTDAVEGRRVIASNIRELQALPCLCEPDTFGAQN